LVLSRAPLDSCHPAAQIRQIVYRHAGPIVNPAPAPVRYVGDGEIAGEPFMPGQLDIEHSIEALHLVLVAINGAP
jgi:hypothetical protein